MTEETRSDRVFQLTANQRRIIDEAIAKARKEFAKEETDEGRLLEVICVDFLESFEPI